MNLFCSTFIFIISEHVAQLPKSGTDIDVEGIISANSKKNTVNDSRMDMDNDTCKIKKNEGMFEFF